MTQHAFLPPSGAGKWRYCSLWPTMNQRYPDTDNAAALEGTAAHRCIAAPEPPSDATADMLKGRELWLQATAGPYVYQATELHVGGTAIHPTLNHGTPDKWVLGNGTLTVFDYKFGYGQVEVFENWQLINYAALILEYLQLSDLQVSVRLVIVQPRGYHRDGPVRTWSLPQAALLRGYWNQLRAAAVLATTAPEGTVGTHCKHCPGRHACDALQRNTLQAIDESGSSVPLEMSPEAVGNEWRRVRRALKLMEARETGLAEQAKTLLMQGQRVPYVRLEESKLRARWNLPIDQIVAIGQTLGLDLALQEVTTPVQARELGMPIELITALSSVPRGELRVVEDDLRKLFGASK